MLTTEKQAREKWCPFGRPWSGPSAPVNRAMGGKPSRESLCLGSDCMAWRWSRTLKKFGHCGLAGTPIGDDAGAKAEQPS
jgi:hypothetical protein